MFNQSDSDAIAIAKEFDRNSVYLVIKFVVLSSNYVWNKWVGEIHLNILSTGTKPSEMSETSFS